MSIIVKFFLDKWDAIPAWVKWPIAIIVIPNLVVNAIILFTWGVPFIHSEIDAKIIPMRERRDEQIANMLKLQEVHNQAMLEGLKRVEQHQALTYQALLQRTR